MPTNHTNHTNDTRAEKHFPTEDTDGTEWKILSALSVWSVEKMVWLLRVLRGRIVRVVRGSSAALRPLFACTVFFGSARFVGASEQAADEVQVTIVPKLYDANRPEASPHLTALMKEDPRLKIEMWSGLSLRSGNGRAPIIMAIAGNTAPDIMESWFHIIRNDVDQGLLYPLNEWVGDDLDGDGLISPAEAKWSGWKNIPELWRKVATRDGKVYGIKQANDAIMGIIFRTDLVRNAGLDPNNPPKTWDEFYEWCLRLCDPGRPVAGRSYNAGQKAIALDPYGFAWIPWIEAAGGSAVVQTRVDPKTGVSHTFPLDARDFRTSDGADLSQVKPVFRASFDSSEALKAAEFFHRLRWGPWIYDDESGKPVGLTETDVAAGFVQRDGRIIRFQPTDVRWGVAQSQSGARGTPQREYLGRGAAVMVTWFVQDLLNFGASSGVAPELLSWFPFPSIDASKPRVVQIQSHFAALTSNVAQRPKAERDEVWKVLRTLTGPAAKDEMTRTMVVSGFARFVNPHDLERLGFHDYLRDVPAMIREYYREIETGEIKTHTEPYQGFWITMDGALNREVLGLILAETGRDFDYRSALQRVTAKANGGEMFGRTEAELSRYRTPARIVFAIIALGVCTIVWLLIRSLSDRAKAGARGMVSHPLKAWLLLLPALLLIGLWGYYPLGRGLVMAFQNFHISGESTFVGLDNFIGLALDESFWASMGRTLYYVGLNLLFSFTAPIILAVMLSEVPLGKTFYRTLFFLPQVTSGLVVALLWKLMYAPDPTGMLNQLIALLDRLPGVNIGPQSWLLDPKLAMLCVVVPTAWATAGMQSLIYIAALKGVPEEIYEACEIDSGSIWTKLRHVTLPMLLPLILINFVGAFISTFQNMGNIFLLTFGGPGESTMVVGMRVWIEAYNNLRFSVATSMAWVMGAALIGFTFVQMQLLKRVEFRKTEN
ncbi:MAG TPA: extracellular solute-binding protein [Opitutaceae bacterium]|nr:extracellular solute-binding protein [Opitutaceae bacterium]